MIVQYFGGPADGGVDQIPDDTKLWIMMVGPTDQHAYAITAQISATTGARIFEYVGERVKK